MQKKQTSDLDQRELNRFISVWIRLDRLRLVWIGSDLFELVVRIGWIRTDWFELVQNGSD